MALISGFSTAGLVQNKLHLNIHNHHRIGSVDHITQSVSVKLTPCTLAKAAQVSKVNFSTKRIRPLPSVLDFDRSSLHFGHCVDAYYQEAWWEGVVFYHENDAEFRSMFFPDIGDMMQIRAVDLRITRNWDEFTEEWRPRGKWLFLELIEQFKQENLIHVSSREIWYEASEKVPKTKLQYSVAAASRSKTALRAGVNQYQPSYNNDYVEESFWLKLVKETFWALKSLFTFLLEQPSQLQYIEWPSFQSTLKTATLTLVLVALLIVALASVDSALAFLLALLLRKPA